MATLRNNINKERYSSFVSNQKRFPSALDSTQETGILARLAEGKKGIKKTIPISDIARSCSSELSKPLPAVIEESLSERSNRLINQMKKGLKVFDRHAVINPVHE
jgi:hypothetical protein